MPVGTTIDATRGTLKLTNIKNSSGKLQTGSFWGGAFTFRQTRGKQATTVLTLTAPLSCSKSRLHPASGDGEQAARAPALGQGQQRPLRHPRALGGRDRARHRVVHARHL